MLKLRIGGARTYPSSPPLLAPASTSSACSRASRGFEFIQQTWLANPGFLGLHNELDPIVGTSNGRSHITIPAEPFRLRLTNIPTVVTSRGGGYFFVPSSSPVNGRMSPGSSSPP